MRILRIVIILIVLLLLAISAAYLTRDTGREPSGTPPTLSEEAVDATASEPPAAAPAEPMRLQFEVSEDGRRVSGSFDEVHFEAEAVAETQGWARYWLPGDDSQRVEVTIEDRRLGLLNWRGLAVTGRGAVDGATAGLLGELADGPLAEALALVPLDLACQPAAEPIPGAAGAALLMPWQVLLKYVSEDPPGEAERLSESSVCGYFGHPPQSSGLRLVPNDHVMALSREERIPVVFLFLPLDGEGQRGSQP